MDRQPPIGRPNLGGEGRQDAQRRLNPVTVDKRLAIIAHHDLYGMRATVVKFYESISDDYYESKRTMILCWRRNRAKLAKAAADGKGSHAKVRGLGTSTILFNDMELEIVQWVNDLREDGVPVSPRMLSEKARMVAKEADVADVADFRASDKWIVGFKGRHKFSLRVPTRQSQITPDNLNDIGAAFASTVEATMHELEITRVFNADQTAMKTLNRRGEKTVWVKCSRASKERATVMLLGDSDGMKYTPFVVFKANAAKTADAQAENLKHRRGFGVRVWADISKISESVDLQVHGNPKGWWNGGLSNAFLQYHFASRPSTQEPVLLLWDDFSGHWTPSVQAYAKSINVWLLKVPPHATSVSQPADVAWNYPLKCRLRQLWHDDMCAQIARPREPGVRFKLAKPKRDKICSWIDQAWRGLSTSTIANGFRGSDLLPSENCIAAASLVSQLEELSLLQGRPVDEREDFALNSNGEVEV